MPPIPAPRSLGATAMHSPGSGSPAASQRKGGSISITSLSSGAERAGLRKPSVAGHLDDELFIVSSRCAEGARGGGVMSGLWQTPRAAHTLFYQGERLARVINSGLNVGV